MVCYNNLQSRHELLSHSPRGTKPEMCPGRHGWVTLNSSAGSQDPGACKHILETGTALQRSFAHLLPNAKEQGTKSMEALICFKYTAIIKMPTCFNEEEN